MHWIPAQGRDDKKQGRDDKNNARKTKKQYRDEHKQVRPPICALPDSLQTLSKLRTY
jgi:hypothetical protein